MGHCRVSRLRAFATICAGVASIAAAPAVRGIDLLAVGPRSLRVSIDGNEVPRGARFEIRVDQVVDEVDVAIVILGGIRGGKLAKRLDVGANLEVDAGAQTAGATPIFKGEVVAIEPVFDEDGETRIVIRAFNRLHRLSRGRKTRAFENITDAEIVTIIATEHGLSPKPSGDVSIRHEHVFQHNQTDLEFLLERAARIGHEVFVDDTALVFRKRVEETAPPIVLAPRRNAGDARLRRFLPRLSSAASIQTVMVRGFDPQSGAEVVGHATAPTILLTGEDGPAPPFGTPVSIVTDTPLGSVEEADELALASLFALTAARISAEALTRGDPRLKAGIVVEIDATDQRFDGKYLVQGASHRYQHPRGCGGGYRTIIRLRREDHGMFRIPAIDDEVLVAFEHGDISRPLVVGSLWDSDDRPPRCDDEDDD